MAETFKTYNTLTKWKLPLVEFIINGLQSSGCTIVHRPSPTVAPFRFVFDTPEGERIGLVVYAFHANNTKIKNRPPDEHRFQIKYGGKLKDLEEIWQDPYGLYVTLLVGINPEFGFFVAADPLLHNPTRFSVSFEFKNHHVEQIERKGWFTWERDRRGGLPDPKKKRAAHELDEQGLPLFEVLVGGKPDQLLKLVRFERESYGEPPGERQLLAENFIDMAATLSPATSTTAPAISPARLHALCVELQLSEEKVLDLIANRRMLKMAVRGSAAEEHLITALGQVPGVTKVQRLESDKGPDVEVSYKGRNITIECKNSSRELTAAGLEKIDLQKTRSSKSDPCSRFYRPSEFDLVAACVHAVTQKWEFKFAVTSTLDAHAECPGRISNNVKLDTRWTNNIAEILDRVVAKVG